MAEQQTLATRADKALAWFMQFEWACRFGPVRRAFLRDTGPCGCGRHDCPYAEVEGPEHGRWPS